MSDRYLHEAHPSPYPHDVTTDPTGGEWVVDSGDTPAFIYTPSVDGSAERLLIAVVLDGDDSEQCATNARTLAASAAMLRMLRAFQRDMDNMGFGTDESIDGSSAVDLLKTIFDEIESLFDYYNLPPSQRKEFEA